MRKSIRCISILAVLGLAVGGCKKESQPTASGKTRDLPFPVPENRLANVRGDLQNWVDNDNLTTPQQEAFDDFCAFLATRRYCDTEIAQNRMTEATATSATQPMLDRLAARGEPAETVILELLEARKNLEHDARHATYGKEDPEIFATIVLWKQRSERAVPLLMELAKDTRFEERAVFVRGLARIGDERAIPLLKDLAQADPKKEVRREALMGLAMIPEVEARGRYLRMLAANPDPEVLRFLRELAANDPDESIRRQAEAAAKAVMARMEMPGQQPVFRPIQPPAGQPTSPPAAQPTTVGIPRVPQTLIVPESDAPATSTAPTTGSEVAK